MGSKAYYRKNCDAIKKQNQIWRLSNPDKVRKHNADRYAKDPEKVNSQSKQWAKENPNKRRAIRLKWNHNNAEQRRIANREWAKNHPANLAAARQRRRARKNNAGGRGISSAQWARILEESLGICAYCNTKTELTMDHIHALSRGGEHDIDNVAAVCKRCNSSKGTTSLLIWLAIKND